MQSSLKLTQFLQFSLVFELLISYILYIPKLNTKHRNAEYIKTNTTNLFINKIL